MVGDTGKLLGVPSLVWWTFFSIAVAHVIFRETRFGAHILATGDNPRAAQVSGIKVPRIRDEVSKKMNFDKIVYYKIKKQR